MSPNAALKFCVVPGCPERVARGRCAKHRQQAERQRGTAAERGYDAAWAKFSKSWLTQHPLCGERADGQLHAEHSRCVEDGRETPANATDHIVSMANGGDKYAESNLQSLCIRCNTRKRNVVDGGGARR